MELMSRTIKEIKDKEYEKDVKVMDNHISLFFYHIF